MQSGVNYYELFQVSQNADAETIERIYRLLAARYHPDNPRTGDVERFHLITEAYRTLRDPDKRREYDSQLEANESGPIPIFLEKEFSEGIDAESKLRLGMLCLLYNRRRSNADHAALSLLDMEELMAIPRESLLFAIWYLRSKQFVLQDDSSSYIITAEGVDFLEAQLPNNQTLYKIFRASQGGGLNFPKALPSKMN